VGTRTPRSVGAGLPEYRIFETRTFGRDLQRLGASAAKRLRAALATRFYAILRVSPRQVPSAARLRDWEPPTWRIRIGSWRVFYEIDDRSGIVFLTAVEHRKDAYR
jgi:mRNA interferase RelE/StbE